MHQRSAHTFSFVEVEVCQLHLGLLFVDDRRLEHQFDSVVPQLLQLELDVEELLTALDHLSYAVGVTLIVFLGVLLGLRRILLVVLVVHLGEGDDLLLADVVVLRDRHTEVGHILQHDEVGLRW